MTYELKNSYVYGKILAKDGRPVITNYDEAMKLADRFNGTLWKVHTGRYMIKLPETATSIEECGCGNTEPVINPMSSYSEEPRDNEVHMARQELYRTAKLSLMLHEILKNVDESKGLDGWVQRKLTRAADYIESVFDYMDYEMRYPENMHEDDQQQMQSGGTPNPSPTQQTQQTPGTAPKAPGMSKTPGMVKMAKLDTNGNVQGVPVMVPSSQVKSKQQAGFHVIGESASAGASSAGGIAVGAVNGGMGSSSVGSLFGGTYTQKKKKKKTESAMSDAEKHPTGPKFTGYWKGTDKGVPGKKMVGGGP
jgi:hypothetical protein